MLTQVDLTTVVKRLNELVKIDPECAAKLVQQRVDCKPEVGEHLLFIVNVEQNPSRTRLGLLGVINSFFREKEPEFGPIIAVFNDEGKALGFVIHDPNAPLPAVPPVPPEGGSQEPD